MVRTTSSPLRSADLTGGNARDGRTSFTVASGVRAAGLGIFGLALLAAVAIANGETATRIAERAIASLLVATDKLSARGHLPDAELQSKFNLIAARHFDRNAMARAALGTQLPAEARANWSGYRRAYDAFLAKSFVRGVRDAGAAVSAVKGARIGPSASPVVASESRTRGRRADIFWLMCRDNPRRVCDVEVDGIRASARQRATFVRIIADGSFARLLDELSSGRIVDRLL